MRETFASDGHGAITGESSPPWVSQQIKEGRKKYAGIAVPTLAVFAVDNRVNPDLVDDERSRHSIEALETIAKARTQRRADAFKRDVPDARIVLVGQVPHHLFLAKPDDIQRLIESFMVGLSRR